MTILNDGSTLYKWLTNPNERQNLLLKFPKGKAVFIEKKFPFGVVASKGKLSEGAGWNAFTETKKYSVEDYTFEKKEQLICSEEDLVKFIWDDVFDDEMRLAAMASYITYNSDAKHVPNYEEY